MSNNVTINNSIYEFNTFLGSGRNCEAGVIPITKGSIEYLEIEDNLSFPGLKGNITISNFDGIISKQKSFDLTTGLNLITFDIINKDFLSFNTRPVKLTFEGVLNEAGESSANMVDKKLTFTFEEAIVSLLRNKLINAADIRGECTASDVLKLIITKGLNEKEEDIIGQFEPTEVPAPVGGLANLLTSNYELLRKVLRHTYYEKYGEPSLMTVKTVCEDNDFKRKFVLINLAKFIREFFEKVYDSESETTVDLSDYVTDTFTMGGAPVARNLAANFVDKYDIIKPDYKNVLAKRWIDYYLSPTGSSGITSARRVSYDDLRDFFQSKILGYTYEANLPLKAPGATRTEENGIFSSILIDDPAIGFTPEIKEWSDSIRGIVCKSFIFDNTAITFRAKGNLYREAGKFIRIVADSESTNKIEDINGYYFVVSVKHIFKGEGYENEFVAVKLYLNQKSSLTPLEYAGKTLLDTVEDLSRSTGALEGGRNLFNRISNFFNR